MFNKLIKLNLALFVLIATVAHQSALATDEITEKKAPLEISEISIQTIENVTEVMIVTNQSVSEFQDNTIAGTESAPARMYIDLPEAALGNIQNEYIVGKVLDKVRVALNDSGARIVFDAGESSLFDYTITNLPEGLKVVINTSSTPEEPVQSTDSTLDALIESSVAELEKQPMNSTDQGTDVSRNPEDNFKVSGFNTDRISVDFYKIDLHNVFRLFREVSGMNIIVDEKVNGTLTLSLNDVPWDFALDIILNLSDLKKEERFNTIVIYPAASTFTWPERTSLENLDIETDNNVLEQETLIVQQTANLSKEIMLAQQVLKKAKKAESRNDFEEAAQYYEEALALWPENTKISNRLSTLYLVELRMNAKAVYHAANALKSDPTNYKAALYAAIGSANMQQKAQAMEYFNQSVSGNPPMQEALLSYSAFNEQNKMYQEALTLIDKHHEYYGESLATMLSRARIYDKQGDSDKATQQYRTLLTSGYQLRPDLKKYINDRLAAGNIQN